MKTVKLLFLMLATGLMTMSMYAADLIVEENGVLPNYASIQDAVNAASDGDRIFIKNQAGNVPYMENVTINVSVELLPFDSDGEFIVLGSFTLNPAIGRTISIIGMNNQVGSVSMSANSPAGSSSRVNVLGCLIQNGSISITGTNIISHISGNQLNAGSITARYSTITGNLLLVGGITVNNASSLSSQDTLYVVGNRILANGRISWANSSHYFAIDNNFVRPNGALYGVYATAVKAGSGTNTIVNNSVYAQTANSRGVWVNTNVPTGATIEIHNNAMYQTTTTGTSYPIYVNGLSGGAFVGYFYNIIRGWDGGYVCGGCASAGNASNTVMTIDLTTGECPTAECVNQGNPSTDYTDLDLSRNDAGTKGGSFNFSNFFPILTGGARVYLVRTPRTVLQTSTIKAEAEAYDR